MKNIGEAFTFPFKDPDWVPKILLGAFFSLLSIILIGIPVIYGYYIELLQRVRNGEQNPLPEWKDVGIKFITGLKYLVTLLIYFLPMVILFVPVLFVIFISAWNGSPLQEAMSGAAMMVFLFLVAIPYSLFITLLTPIISIQFARNEWISDGLNIGGVFKYFKMFWQDTLIVVLISIGIESLASIGLIFFLVGIFVTSFYAAIVKFHLYGQISRSISGIESRAIVQQ